MLRFLFRTLRFPVGISTFRLGRSVPPAVAGGIQREEGGGMNEKTEPQTNKVLALLHPSSLPTPARYRRRY
jgi:hypothetical protein